jgi:hypothetical protein
MMDFELLKFALPASQILRLQISRYLYVMEGHGILKEIIVSYSEILMGSLLQDAWQCTESRDILYPRRSMILVISGNHYC